MISSADFSESRASLDLDLLVGVPMKTEIQIGPSEAESKNATDNSSNDVDNKVY